MVGNPQASTSQIEEVVTRSIAKLMILSQVRYCCNFSPILDRILKPNEWLALPFGSKCLRKSFMDSGLLPATFQMILCFIISEGSGIAGES